MDFVGYFKVGYFLQKKNLHQSKLVKL